MQRHVCHDFGNQSGALKYGISFFFLPAVQVWHIKPEQLVTWDFLTTLREDLGFITALVLLKFASKLFFGLHH